MQVFPIILIPDKIEKILQSIDSELQRINRIPSVTVSQQKHPQRDSNISKPLKWWVDIIFILTTIVFFALAMQKKQPIIFISWLVILTIIRLLDTNYKSIRKAFSKRKMLKSVDSINKTVNYQKIKELRARICRIFSQTKLGQQNKTNAQVGYSEDYFKKYLEKYFPGCIFDQMEFPIDGADFPYSADFIYSDSDGIKIDIEVDEPYSYKIPQPIHFLNNNKDERRNKYFLKNGWIVVRFAEEQVVRYPRECCKALAQLISKINGKPYFETFKGVANLKTMPIWSESSAIIMLNQKYRDSYTHIIKNNSNEPAIPDDIDVGK